MEQLEHEGFCRTKSFHCCQFCLVAATALKGSHLWDLAARKTPVPLQAFFLLWQILGRTMQPMYFMCPANFIFKQAQGQGKIQLGMGGTSLCCRTGVLLAVTPSIASGVSASLWQLPAKQLGVMLSLEGGTARAPHLPSEDPSGMQLTEPLLLLHVDECVALVYHLQQLC